MMSLVSSTFILLSAIISLAIVGSVPSNLKCSATGDNGMKLHVFSGHILLNTSVNLENQEEGVSEFIGTENECIEKCIEDEECTAILVGGEGFLHYF